MVKILIYDWRFSSRQMQNVAIRNVTKLLQSYGNEHNPESDNPSTRVHLLVEVLNSLVL